MQCLFRVEGRPLRAFALAAFLSGHSGAMAHAAELPVADELPTVAVDSGKPGIADTVSEAPVTQFDTIVVTGELLSREANRTTTSVAVRTGAELERSTITDVYEVMRATANVSVQQGFYNIGDFSLRGISTYGGGANTGQSVYGTTTAIVLDGVGLPRSALTASDLSAFDLAQVEIFRGPQSTNQGRNAMAGAVVITTRAPDIEDRFTADARARAAGYSENGYQAAFAGGFTFWPERGALRFVTDHRRSDGDLNNITRNEDDWAQDRSHGNRLRLALTPFGAESGYRIDLSGIDSRRISGGSITEQINEDRREATDDSASRIDSEVQLLSVAQSLQFAEAWQLQATTALFRTNYDAVSDTGYTAANDGYYQSTRGGDGISQELRVNYAGNTLRGTLGAYWYDGHDDEHFSGVAPVTAYLGFFLPICNVPSLCELLGTATGNLFLDAYYPTDTTNVAVFGEAEWQALPRLTLTAGLRIDREDNSRVVDAVASGDTPVARAVVGVVQAAGIVAPNGQYAVSKEFDAVLPKFSLSYEVFDGWFASATYSEGYRAGGSGYNPQSGRRYEIEAEYTRNYEVAFKGRYAPLAADVALNVFRTDWDDMQVDAGTGVDYYVDNAGQARIDGAELELRLPLHERLRLIGSVGLTDGRFIRYLSTRDADGDRVNDDYSGNRLPKAPRHSGSVAVEWSPFDGVLVRPDVSFRGQTPSEADDAPQNRIDASHVINLRAQWQLGSVTLFAGGTNLTDEQYRTDAVFNEFSRTYLSALAPGRRVYAGIDWSLW